MWPSLFLKNSKTLNIYSHSHHLCHEGFLCKLQNLRGKLGVPAVAQWVKNPTAVVQVAEEAQAQSPSWCSGLKDQALPQLWYRTQLYLGFNPWPRNFHTPRVQSLKKKKEVN